MSPVPTLYEMLTGRTPFEAEDPVALMSQHIFQPPPPLAQRVPGVNPVLAHLIHTMLEKDMNTRPSVVQVAQELQRLTQNSSKVSVPTPSVDKPPAGSPDEDETFVPIGAMGAPLAAPNRVQPQEPEVESGLRSTFKRVMRQPRKRILFGLAGLLPCAVVIGVLVHSQPGPSTAMQQTRAAPVIPEAAVDASAAAESAANPVAEVAAAATEAGSSGAPNERGAASRKNARNPDSKDRREAARILSSEDRERYLNEAQQKASQGDLDGATRRAYLVAQTGDSAQAWALYGHYGCRQKNLAQANEALAHLDGRKGSKSTYHLAWLTSNCAQSGVGMGANQRFMLGAGAAGK